MAEQIDVDVTRRMPGSADAVWAVISDLNRLPEWLQFAAAVEDVSGPAQPGATYTVKPHKRYEPTTHWTVAESNPPSRQLHTSEMPVVSGVRSLLEVSGDDSGATVHVRWTGTPKGIMGRLMRPMMQKRITDTWERSLEALDRLSNR